MSVVENLEFPDGFVECSEFQTQVRITLYDTSVPDHKGKTEFRFPDCAEC